MRLIEGLALRRPRPSVATATPRQAVLAVGEHGWPAPSYSTVYDIVSALDPHLMTLAHNGPGAAADYWVLQPSPPVAVVGTGAPRTGQSRGLVVQAPHLPVPLMDAEFFAGAAGSRGLEQRISAELAEREPGGRAACFVSPLTPARRRR